MLPVLVPFAFVLMVELIVNGVDLLAAFGALLLRLLGVDSDAVAPWIPFAIGWAAAVFPFVILKLTASAPGNAQKAMKMVAPAVQFLVVCALFRGCAYDEVERGLERVEESFPLLLNVLLSLAIIIALLAMGFYCVRRGSRPRPSAFSHRLRCSARRVFRRLKTLGRDDPYPPGTWTKQSWLDAFRAGTLSEQNDMLVRSDHHSLSISFSEFLVLLSELRPTIAKLREPVVSTYWQKLDQLMRETSQEWPG